jgi:peptidoglycan/xylan/chitin deacetylase (PgdA/CDA1 family)
MSLVSRTKHVLFDVARRTGLMAAVRRSDWRRRRLLILCYHGVSVDDEHEWNPHLYLRQDVFRQRMASLARTCDVLPLGEGLQRLHDGTLPRAAVSITVDDGPRDFLTQAWPVLKDLSLPVTVYQTTYYVEHPFPVFDTFASYLLWKARGRKVTLGKALLGASPLSDARLDLADAGVRAAVQERLITHASEARLSGVQKDDVLTRLAQDIDVDIASLRARRILHLLTRDEIAHLAREGVDFQLHTHRHRTPREAREFALELSDNAQRLTALTHRPSRHFCYPSGVYRASYPAWLQAAGVISATTCDPGIATATDNPFLLPRLIDTEELSDLTFEAWTSGLAEFLPRRTRRARGAFTEQ